MEIYKKRNIIKVLIVAVLISMSFCGNAQAAEMPVAISAGLFDEDGWKELDKKIYGYEGDDEYTFTDVKEEISWWDSLKNLPDPKEALPTFYAGIMGEEYASEIKELSEVSAIEKAMSRPLVVAAIGLWYAMSSSNINISIDGLVYGRMAWGYAGKADFTHFGLEANNPYGIASATFYYALRNVILTIIPVVFLILLGKQLLNHSGKNRALLKEFFENALLMLILLFAMPYLLNAFIYLRDAALFVTSKLVSSTLTVLGISQPSFGTSIVINTLAMYLQNPTTLNSFLVLAAVGSGLFFFGTYVVTALLLTGCFGLFPIVALISIWKKQVLTVWFDIFIPNLLVNFVDLLLMLVPSIIYAVYIKVFGETMGIILPILILIIIWNVVKVRDKILQKIFGYEGMGRRSGLGLGGLAFMAMRFFGKGSGFGNGAPQGQGLKDAVGTTKDMIGNEAAKGALMEKADLAVPKMSEDLPLTYDMNLDNKTNELLSLMDEGNSIGNRVDDIRPNDIVDRTETMLENQEVGFGVPDDVRTANDDFMNDLNIGGEQIGNLPDNIIEPDNPNTFDKEDYLARVESLDAMNYDNSPSKGRKVSMPSAEEFIDSEFENTLGTADKARYRNLAQMDALNSQISSNEATMRSSGYNRATYHADRDNHVQTIERLNSNIEKTKVRMAAMPDKSSADYVAAQKLVTKAEQGVSNHTERLTQLKNASQLDADNAVYRQKVQECQQIEQRYASNRGIGGMDDTRYNSAHDYSYQMRANEIKKTHANYKNFDARAYDGILSPQEKERFYRERNLQMQTQKLAKVALGASFAVPAAFFAAYGGGTSSLSAVGMAALGGAKMVPDITNNGVGKSPVPQAEKNVKISNVSMPQNSNAELERYRRMISENAATQAMQGNQNMELERYRRMISENAETQAMQGNMGLKEH